MANTCLKSNIVQYHHQGLLPRIDGPKLGPFHSPNFESSNFQFETLLGAGEEGYVFKATLNEKTYAVKIFKFYDINSIRFRFSRNMNAQLSDEELVGNCDPFYAECRAYGRIEEICKERPVKGLIAARCYGYIFISTSHERDIEAKFGLLDMERDKEGPIRALVKQYIPNKPLDIRFRSVKRMLCDLKAMHKNGLYPIDIRSDNYCGGLLVDFGIALTEPSCVLRVLEKDRAANERGRGLGAFDKMIQDAGIKTRVRASRGAGWSKRTRAGFKRKKGQFVMLDKKSMAVLL